MHARDVILAVVVTGRVTEFSRFLASLEPLNDDPHVHVLALNNGPPADGTLDIALSHARRCALGSRHCVRSAVPLSPLHIARRALSDAIGHDERYRSVDPIVWMLDDDLTFEELRLQHGRLNVANVAKSRLAEARRLSRTEPKVDVLVSGFTGDPPIRPESVLATQLRDLEGALRALPAHGNDTAWRLDSPSARFADDYYDLGESFASTDATHVVRWLPRESVPLTTRDQLLSMLTASTGISRGCTPFRPLLAQPCAPPVFVERADRGGNALFLHIDPLLKHTYPAVPIGHGYSRRSDMIGLTLLSRDARVQLATGCLTLRHDRSLQPRMQLSRESMQYEFAGVLLSRAVAVRCPTDASWEWLTSIAFARAHRIESALAEAARHCRGALAALTDAEHSWGADAALMELAATLRSDLVYLEAGIGSVLCSPLHDALCTREILAAVHGQLDAHHPVSTA